MAVQFFNSMDPETARETIARIISGQTTLYQFYTMLSRYFICVLAIMVVVRCAISLLRSRREAETWGYLDVADTLHLPIVHWENTIGRSRASDIVLNYPTVSRSHAVLLREDDGWYVQDVGSKSGTTLNGKPVTAKTKLRYDDDLTFGGVPATLLPLSDEELAKSLHRTQPGLVIRPFYTLLLLTMMQVILAIKLSLASGERFEWTIPVCFALFIGAMWAYFFVFRVMKRRGFEVDIIAFFLATLGLAVTSSSEPGGVLMQFVAMLIGLAFFIALGYFLRDLNRAVTMRWPAAIGALSLLLFTIVFGSVVNGAKNWIIVGNLSIQPSEVAKVFFVYAGAATLDRLYARRNMVLYISLTMGCAGAVAYMSDFGAILIFFIVFLVVVYFRSGNVFVIAFMIAAAVFAGLILLRFKPYIAARFASWRHAWDVPHDGGYQQTRTMSAAASGGLFGIGAGDGWLRSIPAADTDLVFGMVCEELGLIVAAAAVACLCILAVFAARSAFTSRSSFYSIAACCATALLVFQATLNITGAVDILPQTGVTFPFVSNGGSSLVSSFGMLAFIKAADTRQNASFALLSQRKILRKRGDA